MEQIKSLFARFFAIVMYAKLSVKEDGALMNVEEHHEVKLLSINVCCFVIFQNDRSFLLIQQQPE